MPNDPPRDDEPEEAPPRRRLPLVALTLRLAAASAVVAALSLLARPSRPAPPPAEAPMAAFVPAMPAGPPVAAPPAAARLGLAEPGLDPVRVEPGRHDPATGLREDTLSRGAFEALEAPAFRLTLGRGPGADRAPGLFVLLARRAAGGPALAVLRTGAYGRIATKFGAVETMEAVLAGPVRRTCTGFVTREAPFRLDGWLCAPLGRAPEPRALACTLDALDLDDPADPAASAAFRAAEARRRPGCEPAAALAEAAGRTGSLATATPRRGRRTKN